MNIYLTDASASVEIKAGKIVLRNNEELFEFPIRTVDEVCIGGNADVSSKVISKLAENGINVSLMHGNNIVCNTNSGNFERQKKQFILSDDEPFRLKLSKKLIISKVRNQFSFLNEFADETISLTDISDARTRSELLGIEGSYARKYFQSFSRLFPEETEFRTRKKHPATDPVNSMLSYVYSMLYRKYTVMIQNHGLNPCIGFMHDIKTGHYALASDLMEPFRSELADRIVYDIVLDGFNTEDFEHGKGGSIFLSKYLRSAIIDAFDEYCEKPTRTHTGFSNTIAGKMEEQLCSYIKAVDEDNADLFEPYMKGCA